MEWYLGEDEREYFLLLLGARKVLLIFGYQYTPTAHAHGDGLCPDGRAKSHRAIVRAGTYVRCGDPARRLHPERLRSGLLDRRAGNPVVADFRVVVGYSAFFGGIVYVGGDVDQVRGAADGLAAVGHSRRDLEHAVAVVVAHE